jgi:hypothetical protein
MALTRETELTNEQDILCFALIYLQEILQVSSNDSCKSLQRQSVNERITCCQWFLLSPRERGRLSQIQYKIQSIYSSLSVLSEQLTDLLAELRRDHSPFSLGKTSTKLDDELLILSLEAHLETEHTCLLLRVNESVTSAFCWKQSKKIRIDVSVYED